MSDVLRFRPLSSPELATDHRELGSVAHSALAQIHRNGSAKRKVTGEESDLPEKDLLELFCEVVEQELERGGGSSRIERALQLLTRRKLAEVGEMYVEQLNKYNDVFREVWGESPLPYGLEVAFGDAPGLEVTVAEHEETTTSDLSDAAMGDRDKGEVDSGNMSSVSESVSIPPLEFGHAELRTLVQGRIDRVDVGRHEGKPVFNVIDYKSGRAVAVTLDDIRNGKSLQLALYLAAVSRSGLAGEGSLPFQLGYWLLQSKGFMLGLKTGAKAKPLIASSLVPLSEELLIELDDHLEAVVPELAAGIRAGQFPVDSGDTGCTQYCPYSTICRVGQKRTVEVPLGKLRREPGQSPGNKGSNI